jgi:hypothetical protein
MLEHCCGDFHSATRALVKLGTDDGRLDKDSPRPVSLLHQTLQLALCIGADSGFLASTKPRFVRRTARWWSVIHHSRERVSTESNGGFYRHLAFHMFILGLCEASRPWKLISWSCRQTDCVASRGSLELGSECCNRGQAIFTRYALQYSAVLFCELVWPTTLRLSHCCS